MRIVLASVLAMLLSSSASAGILLEPYIGYEKGGMEGTVGGTADFDLTGSQIGAKVGYSMLGLGVGADVMKGSLKAKDNTSSSSDMSPKTTDVGVFVQYTFPIMLKVGGTYFVTSKSSGTSSGTDVDMEGKGTKIGLGYTGLPFIAINLDMISVKYDDIKLAGVTTANASLDRKTYMLSLSLPLDL